MVLLFSSSRIKELGEVQRGFSWLFFGSGSREGTGGTCGRD